MAVPAFESDSWNGAFGTSVAVTAPTGIADDDLLLGFVCRDEKKGVTTVPSGFTEFMDLGTGGLLLYWKIADGESGNYTWEDDNSDGFTAGVMRISGTHLTTPIHQQAGSNEGVTKDPTVPSVTTTADDCLILRIAGLDSISRDYDGWPTSPHTSIQDQAGFDGGSGSSCTVSVYERDLATAGSTGTSTFSSSNNSQNFYVATIAIQPPGGGGGGIAVPIVYHHRQRN